MLPTNLAPLALPSLRRSITIAHRALLLPMWAYSGARVTKYYTGLLKAHGFTPQALAERDDDKDNDFYQHLLGAAELAPRASVLDVGCGMGDLITFLGARGVTPGAYLGLDLVPGFVERCRATYPAPYRFECANFITRRFARHERYDLVVSMGVMVSRVISYEAYVAACVEKMLRLANKYVAFNLITEVDRSQGNFQQADQVGAITFLPRPQLERILERAARAHGAEYAIEERRIYNDASDAFVLMVKPGAA